MLPPAPPWSWVTTAATQTSVLEHSGHEDATGQMEESLQMDQGQARPTFSMSGRVLVHVKEGICGEQARKGEGQTLVLIEQEKKHSELGRNL